MRGRLVQSAVVLLAAGAAMHGALAQSTPPVSASADIPLGLVQSSAGLRLIINVGINGNNPRPYLLDTGSAVFAADYNSSSTSQPGTFWGTLPGSTTGLPANVSLSYTGGGGYTGSIVAVPQLQFYAPGVTTGVNNGVNPQAVLTAPTTSPAGIPAGYQILAVSAQNSGGAFPDEAFGKSSFGGIYGTFGASLFTGTLGGTTIGGVLGQAQVGTTTAGYVVAANGQALSQQFPGIPNSPLNGPQVGVASSVTTCNPCVMTGLTPALLAQFGPGIGAIVPWTVTGGTPFPLSGANSSTEFGQGNFSYTLSGPGLTSVTWANQPTLLDTGTQNFGLRNTSLTPAQLAPFRAGLPSGAGANDIAAGNSITITGSALASTDVVEPGTVFPSTAPYDTTVSTATNNNTVGIPFFLQNSVLFNLAGQAVGFTPNFVTDANIGSSLTVSTDSPGLGLAGIIYDSGAACTPGHVTASCTSVTVAGGGSAVLSGTNTNTGLTTIQKSGFLALAGPGSIAQSAGVQADGRFDISAACAPGTSGACNSPAGSISVSVNDLSGSGTVSLGANNLTVQHAGSNFGTANFSGVLADGGIAGGTGGSLTLAAGNLTLSGANTFTGGTSVAGTLTIASSGSLQANVTEGVGATIDNRGTINGSVANSGGTLNNSGRITGGVTDPPGAMTINTGIINGGVTITAGSALSNSGEIDGDVTDQGIYTGHGHHKGNLDIAGIITASSAIGLTRVDKDLTFETGSVYQALIDGKGNSDAISVGGAIHIKGGTVALVPTSDFAAGLGSYAILSSDTAQLTGKFAGLSTPFGTSFFPFLNASLAYTPSTASIVLTRGAALASAATTANQTAAGLALDRLPQSNPLLQSATLLNYSTAAPVLTAVSGDIYGSATSVMQQESAYLRDAIGGRIRQALAPDGNPQIAALGPTPVPVMPGSLVAVWQQAVGAWGGNASAGNATGIDRSAAGFIMGIDAPIGDGWRAGLASGFDADWFNSTGTAASASMTGVHLAGYAGRRFGPIGIDFGASNTWFSGAVNRSVAFAGFTDSDRGGFDATETQAFGEVTFDQPLPTVAPGALMQPFLSLAYAHIDNAPFAESGGAAALTASASSVDNIYSSIGARGSVPVSIGGWDLKAAGLLGWQHAFGTVAPQVSLALAGGGAPFSVQGAPIARDTALVGAGLRYDQSPTVSFGLSYTGRVGGGVSDNQFAGTLTVRF